MSTDILWGLDKKEIFRLYEKRYEPLYRQAYDLLKTYFRDPELLKKRPDDIFIDNLIFQMKENRTSGFGYNFEYKLAKENGDHKAAHLFRKQAIKKQSMALIFADAAARADIMEGEGRKNQYVDDLVNYNKKIILGNAVDAGTIFGLIGIFAKERERGFKFSDPYRALILGDEGCPDTADVLTIAMAYRAPVIILPTNDRHTKRKGLGKSPDHAKALYEDFYGTDTPQPFIKFVDGSEQKEPTPAEFFTKMFENGMI